MMIKPEIKVFINAMRAGKPSLEAYAEYCWAKSVLPIKLEDYKRSGDPFQCPVVLGGCMAEAKGFDAWNEGATDQDIADAFEDGMQWDHEQGIVYRPMRKEERPTPADLIRSLSLEGQLRAAKFVGLKTVAYAIAGAK